MNLNTYQKKALSTAVYPRRGANIIYPLLGLSGEVGEVCGKMKKVIRDNRGVLSEERRLEMVDELGDCLWYVAVLAYELSVTLDELAHINVRKLASRKRRGVLKGVGDKR